MSVTKNIYIICGYDLTKWKDEIITEEFAESETYDDLTCNKVKGKVQLFDDPMSGEYLYCGVVIGEIEDEWCNNTIVISPEEVFSFSCDLENTISSLMERAKSKNTNELNNAKIIVFTEYC